LLQATSSDQLSRPGENIALTSLSGVVLDALGGLYLAYDLLGAKHGPLRRLSRLLTYSAIFGLGYEITLGSAFGLAGALVSGPIADYELQRRSRQIEPTRTEWVTKSLVRGLAFGIAGSVAVSTRFGIAFGVLTVLAMIITDELGFGTNIYGTYRKPGLDRRLAVAGVIRGILIGVAGVLGGAIAREADALWYGVEIGVVVGVLVNVVAILSPSVEWWVENLPDRALGGYGAFLVLIGSALQTVQYVMPLISN
jgi:hypothetical protein